jgi:hypothetical protein
MLAQLILTTALVIAFPAAAQEFRTVTLMSWNVENLFDTIDDPANPFDDTYLPKTVIAERLSFCFLRHWMARVDRNSEVLQWNSTPMRC